MSTTSQPLTYLWTAYFEDGTTLQQSTDDRYSKHDDTAEWNPSAFRDIEEHGSKVIAFDLVNQLDRRVFGVNLTNGIFVAGNARFMLENMIDEPLTDRKLVYFRDMLQHTTVGVGTGEPYVYQYIFGYEGKNREGKTVKKLMFVEP